MPDLEQLIKNVIKEEKKLKNSGQQTGEHETLVIEQNRRKWEGLAEETEDERKTREAEELEKSREEAELEWDRNVQEEKDRMEKMEREERRKREEKRRGEWKKENIEVWCYRCEKRGHLSRQCREGKKCYKCNSTSHEIRDCTK